MSRTDNKFNNKFKAHSASCAQSYDSNDRQYLFAVPLLRVGSHRATAWAIAYSPECEMATLISDKPSSVATSFA
jgi:hypothetical protein